MAEYFLLVTVFLSIGWLGLSVFSSDPRNASNLSFALLIGSLEVWILCNFFEAEVSSKQLLIWLFRIDFASAAVAAYFFLRLCALFPVPTSLQPKLRLLFIPAIVVSIASLTPLVVTNATIGNFDSQPDMTLGPLFWAYAPVVGGYVFWGTYIMWRKKKLLRGLIQIQASYMLLGMGISATFMVIINLAIGSFIPISATISRLGIYSMLSFAGFTSYAMLRYRMMDMRIFIQESGTYLLTTGILGIIAAIIAAILTENVSLSGYVFGICLVLPYAQTKGARWLEQQKIKRGLYDPAKLKTIESLADRIKDAGYKISDLSNTIVQMIFDEFPVKACSIYVVDYNTRNYLLEAQRGVKSILFDIVKRDDSLIKYFSEHNDLLVVSELERFSHNEQLDTVISRVKILHAELCAPLFIFGQVAGFVAIGRKKDGKPFFVNETRRIKLITDETATVLRYVLAVSVKAKETMKWAHTLHQSLKPLTIGFEFLTRRATANGSDEGLETVVPRLQGNIKRLGEFLRFLLQDSRISEEVLRNKYELHPLNIKEIIEEGLSMHRLTVESKKIQVIEDIVPPSFPLCGHERDLISVFEILTSNALRYTPSDGIIKVTGRSNGSKYIVDFFNNGPTIPNDVLDAIFLDRFQVQDGNQGMEGFGLMNAARIIEMHLGKIHAENVSDNGGVKFVLELPLATEEKSLIA